MTIVDRAPHRMPACRPVSTRRASSWTSTSSRRMRGGWPTARRRRRRAQPHIKTHKASPSPDSSSTPARRGRDHGRTLGEAEAMVDGGIDEVFVGYPPWADGVAERLRRLHERCSLSVRVDSAKRRGCCRRSRGVGRPAARPRRARLGARRSGVAGPADAVAIARAARDAGLEVVGVFTHGGRSYRAPGAQAVGSADEVAVLGAAADALRTDGFAVERISAGSTPTSVPAAGQVTEIGPAHTSSAIASSSSSARSPPTGSPPSSPRPSSRPPSPARSSSTPGPKHDEDRAAFLEGFGVIRTIGRGHRAAVRLPRGGRDPAARAPRLGRSSRSCPIPSARSSSSSTSSSSPAPVPQRAAGRSTRGGAAGERRLDRTPAPDDPRLDPRRADANPGRRGRSPDLRRGDRHRHRHVRHDRADVGGLGRRPPS